MLSFRSLPKSSRENMRVPEVLAAAELVIPQAKVTRVKLTRIKGRADTCTVWWLAGV